MKKILITDPVDKKCSDILQQEGFIAEYKPGLKPEELRRIIKDYNGLIVRSETKVDAALISEMESMEIIGRAGAGVDNIDIPSSTRRGIIVMNTPGGNTISAAEHTIALMLSLCRNIPQADHSLREGKWERKKYTGAELSGKTLLIAGLGKIGKEVAQRCQSFGMTILAYDPVINPTSFIGPGKISFVDLEEGLRNADFITLHVPLSPSTKNLISSETLRLCKDGVRIINCARGGIVNETDLLKAVDEGKVAGAAFDVFENEPPDFNSPLFNHPKIICTPHLGASTEEAQEKVAVQIAEQVSAYFKRSEYSGAVNLPFQKIDPKLERFLELAENIGYLHSQVLKSAPKGIKVLISGDFLHFNAALITTAAIKGFLKERRSENVNLVNAGILLKESGISSSEIKAPDDDNFNNIIEVIIESEEGVKRISGTVFGNREQRILRIDEYLVEFSPEGDYLLYYNVDKPGVLASVSSYLAGAGYNISGVSLGRNGGGKIALSIIGIDGEIRPEIIKVISGTDGILAVYAVKFRAAR